MGTLPEMARGLAVKANVLYIYTNFGLYRRWDVIIGDKCACGGVFLCSNTAVLTSGTREYFCSDCGLIKRTNAKLEPAV